MATPTVRRWMSFNAVGALGFVLQLGTLAVLKGGLGLDYLVATGLAVEVSVLHNFLWHERWTWADRRSPDGERVAERLARFHGATAVISIGGNLGLTWLLVSQTGLHYLLANIVAVGGCSILNFMASDNIVFRSPADPTSPRTRATSPRRRTKMRIPRAHETRALMAVILLGASMTATPAVGGAVPDTGVEDVELRDETVRAWGAYVAATERRIEAELASGLGFLGLDFQPAERAAADRRALHAGRVLVTEMTTLDAGGDDIDIPGGMVHHWRGAVLIPDVTVDEILARVAAPEASDTEQEDVLDSEVLERGPGFLRLYLKLQRTRFVTVTYDTVHLVRYRRRGTHAASSRSIATRIAELQDAGTPHERQRPPGRDRGFLWRLNSYWRYQQVEGGVVVECESLSLSRSIPAVLRFLVAPLVESTARGSMDRTLVSMRQRYLRLAAR